jgi:hypothetical protein
MLSLKGVVAVYLLRILRMKERFSRDGNFRCVNYGVPPKSCNNNNSVQEVTNDVFHSNFDSHPKTGTFTTGMFSLFVSRQ